MGALCLLGIPPSEARDLPMRVALEVVSAAKATRDDVAAYWNAQETSSQGGRLVPIGAFLENLKRQPEGTPARM